MTCIFPEKVQTRLEAFAVDIINNGWDAAGKLDRVRDLRALEAIAAASQFGAGRVDQRGIAAADHPLRSGSGESASSDGVQRRENGRV